MSRAVGRAREGSGKEKWVASLHLSKRRVGMLVRMPVPRLERLTSAAGIVGLEQGFDSIPDTRA